MNYDCLKSSQIYFQVLLPNIKSQIIAILDNIFCHIKRQNL